MSIYKPGRPFKYDPYNNSGNEPPKKAGEYRIRNGESKILYIGETCSLHRRMNEHMKSGKIQSGCSFEYKIADGRSTSVTRREHERLKIEQHTPELNQSHGGEGRIAKK